jgi:hypothetical protein
VDSTPDTSTGATDSPPHPPGWLLRKDRPPLVITEAEAKAIEERNRLAHPEWFEDWEAAE